MFQSSWCHILEDGIILLPQQPHLSHAACHVVSLSWPTALCQMFLTFTRLHALHRHRQRSTDLFCL